MPGWPLASLWLSQSNPHLINNHAESVKALINLDGFPQCRGRFCVKLATIDIQHKELL